MASSTDHHSGGHSDTDDEDPSIPAFPHSSKADRYRIMAEEVRTAAEDMQDMTSRQTLQRIAEDYDRLATRTERRLRGKPISPGVRNHR